MITATVFWGGAYLTSDKGSALVKFQGPEGPNIDNWAIPTFMIGQSFWKRDLDHPQRGIFFYH